MQVHDFIKKNTIPFHCSSFFGRVHSRQEVFANEGMIAQRISHNEKKFYRLFTPQKHWNGGTDYLTILIIIIIIIIKTRT
mgnify:CR=1 FL=1